MMAPLENFSYLLRANLLEAINLFILCTRAIGMLRERNVNVVRAFITCW